MPNVRFGSLASFTRRQEHRCSYPGDGDGRLRGLRHLYPRIQGCCIAGTGRGDRLRREHVLIEILATFVDRSDKVEEQRHRQWIRATLRAFDAMAFPGGYPNFLPQGDAGRAAKSYGDNSERLIRAKRQYDPDNVFSSAIPLPVSQDKRHTAMSACAK
jgi:Berberine and berberine like